MILPALQTLLQSDPILASALAPWDFSDTVRRPAVFTVEPAPPECGNPVIVLVQNGGTPFEDRGHRGSEVSVTVKLWGDRLGSTEKHLRGLATRVWRLLDRCALTLTDYDAVGAAASFPQRTQDAEGYPGYLLTLTIKVMEKGE